MTSDLPDPAASTVTDPDLVPVDGGGTDDASSTPARQGISHARKRALHSRFWRHWVIRPYRQILLTEHPAMERFFARRCTHLAGMIAYFGLLSIIPAAFLFISALGFAGYLSAQGWVVEQLTYIMPKQGVDTIVRTVGYLRDNTGSLGLVGLFGLIWGSTNFFSCIESGLNIIYGVNNRVFLKQKGLVLVLMSAALVVMTAATIFLTVAIPLVRKADVLDGSVLTLNGTDATISVIISLAFAFVFFLSCYRFLVNTDIHTRDVWRGALGAAVAFELSMHILPLYLAFNKDGVVLKAFAGALLVLIWFYLMSLILLAGAVYNWWRVEKRRRAELAEAGDELDTGGLGLA